jgi:hypothetical protein
MLKQRLTGLFFLGLLAFNYPLLTLFNYQITLFGIPPIYIYLFSSWLFLIFFAFLAVVMRRPKT